LLVRSKTSAQKVFYRHVVQGEAIEIDLCDLKSVRDTLRDINPWITFNVAGYGVDRSERDEETAYQVNARLVQAICEGLSDVSDGGWSGQRIVHVGSAAEYGAIGAGFPEDSIPDPTTTYGKSKLAGTQHLSRWCRERGVRGLTARLFTIYGPGEHQGRLLPSLIETARTGKPLALTLGRQKRDFTYVEDAAEGLLRLGVVSARPGEVVNLATGKLTSVREFAEKAASMLGIPGDCLRFGAVSIPEEEKDWNIEDSPVVVKRLLRVTGWLPSTGISEGVGKTLAFERLRAA
jgi:UDP-glucose 4-epimerase